MTTTAGHRCRYLRILLGTENSSLASFFVSRICITSKLAWNCDFDVPRFEPEMLTQLLFLNRQISTEIKERLSTKNVQVMSILYMTSIWTAAPESCCDHFENVFKNFCSSFLKILDHNCRESLYQVQIIIGRRLGAPPHHLQPNFAHPHHPPIYFCWDLRQRLFRRGNNTLPS